MDEFLQNKLFNKYPYIFSLAYKEKYKSKMHLGIKCKNGWYNIIDKLCGKIQTYCNKHLQHQSQVEAVEIKEAYGKLYFFIIGGDQNIYKFISKAQINSKKTCEICGIKKTLNDNKQKTRCKSCV